MGEARGGTELGPKSKTDPPGLGSGQRNVEAFIFKQRGPHQGGVHCALGRGGQQLGVARGGGGLVGAKKPKTESPGLNFGRQNMGASVLGRGNLGRAWKAWLREGGGGSLAGMQSGD